jgi:hypothetical protein
VFGEEYNGKELCSTVTVMINNTALEEVSLLANVQHDPIDKKICMCFEVKGQISKLQF